MDRDEIDEYVQRCQRLIESSPQMDEENTKVKLIHPFLELLGWDLYSTEVTLEYTIPMASGSIHVDYALLVGDSPVVFVEAKPVRSSLSDTEIKQLRSYMRQELDVDWGILTNGKSFEVLTKNNHQNGGEEVSVVQFDLDDLAENPGVLELLSTDRTRRVPRGRTEIFDFRDDETLRVSNHLTSRRFTESIRSGKSDKIADQVAQTNRAIQHLQENEDRVTESVTKAIENEIGDLTIDLEEQSREFVQNLVLLLREQRQFVSEPSTPEFDTNTEQSQSTTASSVQTQENDGYVIRFSDRKEIPETAGEIHTQQKQNMGAAVDYLIEEHDLIDEIEIPRFPPRARKNCSINTEPVHPNGESMRGPYELTTGYYLHTSLDTQGKKNRIRDLTEQVGLTVEFLGEW